MKRPTKEILLSSTLDLLKTVAIAFIFALFITHVVIINAVVPSSSMENTITPGDRLFGSRLTYRFGQPERGDIVIFKYPVNEYLLEKLKDKVGKEFFRENDIRHKNYIKRLIGLPGETVTIKHGKIYINDSEQPLDEPYLKEEWIVRNDGYRFKVPEDCYLMLGDNRNSSADSRYWMEEALECMEMAGMPVSYEELESLSYVRKDQVLGKAYVRYWPITKMEILK